MEKPIIPPLSGSSGGDKTLAVFRSLLGAMPLVGTAANELLNQTVTSPAQNRTERWQAEITKTVNRLVTEVDGVTPESLAENPEFLDAVLFASRTAMVTSRQEKRRMLQTIVFQVGSGQNLDEFIRNTFFTIIERYTPEHVFLLRNLNDFDQITGAFSALRMAEPKKISSSESEPREGDRAKVEDLVVYLLPKIDKSIVHELFTDLHRDNLCHGSEGFAFSVSEQGDFKIPTKRGMEFLRFVSDE